MGNFYVNHTLLNANQLAVASAMAGRSAFIAPQVGGCIVVLDEESDRQDQNVINVLGQHLSSTLDCPVLALLNHDDDILWYQLFLKGNLEDEYNSSPTYFDPEAEPSDPIGGDAGKLCRAFNSIRIAEVQSILRRSSFDENGYAFAVERHADLARALGLPSFVVGAGFDSVSAGLLPDEIAGVDLLKIV